MALGAELADIRETVKVSLPHGLRSPIRGYPGLTWKSECVNCRNKHFDETDSSEPRSVEIQIQYQFLSLPISKIPSRRAARNFQTGSNESSATR